MNFINEQDRRLVEHYRLEPAEAGATSARPDVWHRIRKLGSGGFGNVYLEERIVAGRKETRAVKTAKEDQRIDVGRELLALIQLSAPRYEAFFGQFKGWYEVDNRISLAMEYFPGGDLHDALAKQGGTLPEPEVRDIVDQLLQGVKIMHEDRVGIAHRDIKLLNIFVLQGGPKWNVKIGDFGLSKQAHEGTALRTHFGTYGYMAPELLYLIDEDDESSEYTKSVDIW